MHRLCSATLTLFVVGLFASGCGGSASGDCQAGDCGDRWPSESNYCSESRVEGDGDRQLIEGERACRYYGQFVWERSESLLSGVGPLPGEDDDPYRVTLYLRRSGTALVYYDEGIFGHGYNRDRDSGIRLKSEWRVKSDELLVDQFLECEAKLECDAGECTGPPYRMDPDDISGEVLACTLTADLAGRRFDGARIELVQGGGIYGPGEPAPTSDYWEMYEATQLNH